jgi:calcium-independent phospholipase A2-gamma
MRYSLIAIMLGRLEMTVQACIDAFIEMMDVIFEKRHTLPFDWRDGKIRARYDSEALQTRIKAIIRNAGFSEDTPMRGPKETDCKV